MSFSFRAASCLLLISFTSSLSASEETDAYAQLSTSEAIIFVEASLARCSGKKTDAFVKCEKSIMATLERRRAADQRDATRSTSTKRKALRTVASSSDR